MGMTNGQLQGEWGERSRMMALPLLFWFYNLEAETCRLSNRQAGPTQRSLRRTPHLI